MTEKDTSSLKRKLENSKLIYCRNHKGDMEQEISVMRDNLKDEEIIECYRIRLEKTA